MPSGEVADAPNPVAVGAPGIEAHNQRRTRGAADRNRQVCRAGLS